MSTGRHAWIDASAGVAGDMLLGALVDAGAELDGVQQAVDAVIPGSVRIAARPVTRAGQRATKVDVEVLVADPPHRTWATIRELLAAAELAEPVRDRARRGLRRAGRGRGHVHGIAVDEVHFHEVGALDSIADVVGVCAALRRLGDRHPERVRGRGGIGPGPARRTATCRFRCRPWSSSPAAGGSRPAAPASWPRRPGWRCSARSAERARTCRR